MEKKLDNKCIGYEHKEHTADVLIESIGRTLEEAFEQAAIAVYEVITDTSKVYPTTRVDIDIEGDDLENLLYRWIEELLIYTDSEGLVFSRFTVCRIEEANGKYRITSSAWGEQFNPEKHEERTIVKAMTYAQMKIEREDRCWRLQFVVDI
ncbi:MAG: archease [Desulfurococcales archaeon]|nr:archease [Desulfurococcales archaeon]MEB3788678.1 archease [Desulfurococcales archaeon]